MRVEAPVLLLEPHHRVDNLKEKCLGRLGSGESVLNAGLRKGPFQILAKWRGRNTRGQGKKNGAKAKRAAAPEPGSARKHSQANYLHTVGDWPVDAGFRHHYDALSLLFYPYRLPSTSDEHVRSIGIDMGSCRNQPSVRITTQQPLGSSALAASQLEKRPRDRWTLSMGSTAQRAETRLFALGRTVSCRPRTSCREHSNVLDKRATQISERRTIWRDALLYPSLSNSPTPSHMWPLKRSQASLSP